jgi:ABC-type sugar transport system substrate-binding protein
MKKLIGVLLMLVLVSSMVFAGAEQEEAPIKIAFFVSDMSNVFHQGQFTAAKEYAMEKYGAEVYAFDGKSDGTVMLENLDQVVPQGMDMVSIHTWDVEAARPGINDALDAGVIVATFFTPQGDPAVPVVRSDEAGTSFAMGAEAATQWKKANPDKPIVMVQIGWPNHTEVSSGRTDPFAAGVLSVDPTATNLGCLEANRGGDTTKQVILDLVTQRPEVNIIYSEASNLTVGTMAALRQLGRGTMDNGVPTTEIVASVDFDPVEMKQVYDPNISLKLSMGLPPIETGQGRIDNLFAIKNGEIDQISASGVCEEDFKEAFNISYWTMAEADAEVWLKAQFGN